MSDLIPNIYAVSSNVELVRSIGPNESGMNWDYRDWPRVTPLLTAYEPTDLQRLYPDASHGSIGGAPGYSWTEPSTYQYITDREKSILSDRWIREGLNSKGFVLKVLTDVEYGFPGTQP